MMKGIVFTLDAFFALAVAVMSISLLLYFHYALQTPTVLGYSSASSLLNTLSSSMVTNATSSGILMAMSQQLLGSNETWPKPMQNSLHSSANPYGPLYPILSFMFSVPSTITSSPVADYGKVYFAAGSSIYAINATTGKLAWSRSVATTVSSVALYNGMLVYANTTAIGALNAISGSSIWFTSVVQPISQLLIENGKVVFGASNGNIYAFYITNGTQVWSYTTSSNPIVLAGAAGQIAARLANGNVIVLDTVGTSATQIESISPSSSSTYISSQGPFLFFGSGGYAAESYINMTKITSFSSCVSPTGVAVYNNLAVFECSSSAIGINVSSASQKWSFAAPNGLSPIVNATPVIAGTTTYTLWSGSGGTYLIALNTSSGSEEWQTVIPSAIGQAYPLMALAYGNLYVAAGNNLIAYGACAASSRNVLQDAANLYANGFGSCGTAIVNSFKNTTDYSLSINGRLAPFMSLPEFNGASGSSYIITPPFTQLNNSAGASFSACFYLNSLSSNEILFSDDWNQPNVMQFYIHTNGAIEADYGNGKWFSAALTPAGAVTTGKWYCIAAVYKSGEGQSIYINGVQQQLSYTMGSSNTIALLSASPIGEIAYNQGNGGAFNGIIANIQIYNTSLSQSQAQLLSTEGAQAPPILRNNIVAWYPLEGNTGDYGSFKNSAYPINVNYMQSNYTPPSLANSYQVSVANIKIPVVNYTTGNVFIDSVGVITWR